MRAPRSEAVSDISCQRPQNWLQGTRVLEGPVRAHFGRSSPAWPEGPWLSSKRAIAGTERGCSEHTLRSSGLYAHVTIPSLLREVLCWSLDVGSCGNR